MSGIGPTRNVARKPRQRRGWTQAQPVMDGMAPLSTKQVPLATRT